MDRTGGQLTAGDLRERAARILDDAGIPTAQGDADVIVAHVLGLRRADVERGQADERELEPGQADLGTDLVKRRTQRVPLQHLTGVALFRRLELAVGPGVFVPCRETEFVTQLAVDALRASGSERPIAVDLGTGAGAIALAMATEVPHSLVYGVEVSPEAFDWTARNFAALAPGNGTPVLADMTEALHELNGTVDVVSGNPPFIPDGTEAATPEVQLYDPEVALFGGPDGLALVRAVSRTARRLLRPGGMLAMEHGVSQAARVGAVLAADGWTDIRSHRDPAGHHRVTTAMR